MVVGVPQGILDIKNATVRVTTLETTDISLSSNVVHESDHNAVFRIYRNTTLIGYNNTRSTIDDWNGVVAVPADVDNGSTPHRLTINWVDVPATTNPITYKLYKHEADGASANIFYLNRPVGSTGSNDYEIGVSYVSAIEITQ